MKRFFIGTAKVTLGFLIAFALIAGVVTYRDLTVLKKEKEEKKKLFTLKDWEDREALDLGLSVDLKTKWDEGRMRYQLTLSGTQKKKALEFFFVLKDSDGFHTYVHSLKEDRFLTVHNESGDVTGLKCEGVVAASDFSENDYLKSSSWEFRWTEFTEPTLPE